MRWWARPIPSIDLVEWTWKISEDLEYPSLVLGGTDSSWWWESLGLCMTVPLPPQFQILLCGLTHTGLSDTTQMYRTCLPTETVKIVVTRVGVIPHMILTLLLLVTIQTARYLTASVPQMELLFLVECCQQMFLRWLSSLLMTLWMMKTGISTKTNSFPPTYKNPNGCPIHGTFYVSHQYTNYAMVQKLWNQDMPKLKRLYIAGEGECGSSIRELQQGRGRVCL